jgi:hypothetical protein
MDLSIHYFIATHEWNKMYELLWNFSQKSTIWNSIFSKDKESMSSLLISIESKQELLNSKSSQIQISEENPEFFIGFYTFLVIFCHTSYEYYTSTIFNGSQRRALIRTSKEQSHEKKRKLQELQKSSGQA